MGTMKDLIGNYEKFLELNQIEIKALTGGLKQLGAHRSLESVQEEFYVWHHDDCKRLEVAPPSLYEIKVATRVFHQRLSEQAARSWRVEKNETNRLIDARAQVRKIIDAISADPSELEVAVFCHFLANVKRRIGGKRATDHMLINLCGPAGGGKSRFTQRLADFFSAFAAQTTLDQIAEPRAQPALLSKYLLIVDELAGGSKADIKELKRVLTAEVIENRRLYSNEVESIRVNASVISTSNDSAAETFTDNSEGIARRLFEIKTRAKLDWAAVNDLNFEAIFLSIDIDQDYLDGHREVLVAKRSEFVNKDAVSSFIEDMSLSAGEASVTVQAVYDAYRVWCDRAGVKTLSKIALSKYLKTRIDLHSMPRQGTRFYSVSAEAATKLTGSI